MEDNLLLPPPSLDLERAEFQRELQWTLESLNPHLERILRLRFGLDCEVHTLQNIADLWNLTKERIRQMEHKALRQMRHPSRARKLIPYLEDFDIPKPLLREPYYPYKKFKPLTHLPKIFFKQPKKEKRKKYPTRCWYGRVRKVSKRLHRIDAKLAMYQTRKTELIGMLREFRINAILHPRNSLHRRLGLDAVRGIEEINEIMYRLIRSR